MRGEGTSGMATAGCGALSLVSLLIGVGLVVWLGSRALPDTESATKRRGSSSSTVTTHAQSDALDVSLDPADGLEENTPIVVTVEGLDAKASFSVATCLRGGSLVIGSDDPCDEASARRTTADEAGRATVPYVPARVITAGGLPFDCASDEGTCEVRVTQTTASTEGGSRSGSAVVSFRSDLPRPEVTVDSGG